MRRVTAFVSFLSRYCPNPYIKKPVRLYCLRTHSHDATGGPGGAPLRISTQTYRDGHELYSLGLFSVAMDRFSIVSMLTLVVMFIIYLVASARMQNIVL